MYRPNYRIAAIGVLILASALSGCSTGHDTSDEGSSSSGSSGGGTSSGSGPSTSIAKLNLIASDTTVPSAAVDNSNGVTLTALARDASNNAVPSPDVSFSASDGRLVNTQSNANGTSTVTLYNAPDRADRKIQVTATAGGQSDTITVPVVGTSISLVGPPSVRAGSNADYTATLTDSVGNPISGAETTITPASAVVPSNGVMDTNDNGVVNFSIQTQSVGSIGVTVAADGATTSQTLAVTSNNLKFVDPKSGTVQKVAGQPLSLSVELVGDDGKPDPGKKVEFQTSRGSLSSSTANTNANGIATTTLTSTNAGTTIVDASSINSSQAAEQVQVVAASPNTLLQSANPSTVAVNSSSKITSTVLDQYGNPVSGATIDYNIPDGSAGQLSDANATTDSSGQASVTYTAPADSTVPNTKVDGKVEKTDLAQTTTIRVAGQPLSITLGTTGQPSPGSGATDSLTFTVLATDAAGNPVANKDITIRIAELDYESSGENSVSCPSEDQNNDGVLESGEDRNDNGRLDPGQVASVPKTMTLNQNGEADFDVTYLSQYAGYVKVRLVVTASVDGSEGSQQTDFVLPGSAGANPFDSPCSK